MALIALITVGFELIEHARQAEPLRSNFVREVVIFAVIQPVLGGIMLSLLKRADSERVRAQGQLARHHDLNQQLIESLDWDELTKVLVRFPSTIVPLAGCTLLVSDQNSSRFELAAQWWDPGGPTPPTALRSLDVGACYTCTSAEAPSIGLLRHCDSLDESTTPVPINRYCLRLTHSGFLIGLLHLYLEPNASLSEEQAGILTRMASSMALALHGAVPEKSAQMRTAVARAERRRIARQLHDTLGQELSYLHLKLDQLTGDDTVDSIAAVRQELARMRDVANHAYERVRGTIVDLRPESTGELATALVALGESIGSRANFQVELTSEGQPRTLPARAQRQVLGIVQEALVNVEKHAGAHNVIIELVWAADELTVSLADDGHGFEPDASRPNGHFGLSIMRERAEEIGGSITLTSHPDAGSAVTLRLPLVPAVDAAFTTKGGS